MSSLLVRPAAPEYRCSSCKQFKSSCSFSRDASRGDGVSRNCKQCVSSRAKQRRQENATYINSSARDRYAERRPAILARQAADRENHPDRERRRRRRGHLKKHYGLTLAQYDLMVLEQGGKCAICGARPPAGGYLAVDHCHATGKVRGLLCGGRNSALGKLGDNAAGLERALAYLQSGET